MNKTFHILDPDQDILPRLQAGEDSALAILMDRHLKTITSIGYYMLSDMSLAEDVAQSTFLKLWNKVPEWESGKATLLTWMRRVATNDCLSRLRKKSPILLDTLPDNASLAPIAIDTLEAKERAEAVQFALQKLSDKQRAAITLSYYQGLSQKEGAAILEVGEKAYESLLSRARKKLKETLTPLVEENII